MSEARISGVETRLIRIPLLRNWGPGVEDIRVVAVVVTADDGSVGQGFSWTPSIGGEAVRAMIDNDIVPFVTGLPAETGIWQSVWEHLHEAGSGGVTSIALAGLDLALWDLRGRREGASLVSLLGRAHESQPAYGSGVNLHYDLAALRGQVQRWVDRGYPAVKVKVGKPDLAEDVARLAAVRQILGPDRGLMIDANQRWDLETATRAAGELAQFQLGWIEEPLRSDDTSGYVELRKRTEVPIALGENVHTLYRFRDLIDAGACDIVQPNVVRVGGITPFLRIADLARRSGVVLAPHLLPELSGQLALALPETTWVEDVEDAGFEALGALVRPTGLHIHDGAVHGGDETGLGIEFASRQEKATEENGK